MIKTLQLEITRECRPGCGHCYADTTAHRSREALATSDWLSVISQAADLGIPRIRLTNGEPILHPAFDAFVVHALERDRRVEVRTNLVHVTASTWRLLSREGVSIQTPFYSDDPDQHAHITGRASYPQTLSNVQKATRLGIPLHAAIVRVLEDQRIAEAEKLLAGLGVEYTSADQTNSPGRPAAGIRLDGTLDTRPGGLSPTGDVRVDGLSALLGQLDELASAGPPCVP